ncbi:MAG: DUF1302 family protein [Sterolibacterium sp.]|nr:DUF1302 family protein [Sterolibacterium sp.]MBP9800099.1 DUF1302 family protein [Sterolibacterium sp.]
MMKGYRLGMFWVGCWLTGTAWGFEPVTFDNGAVLDVSAQISYVNMKRLSGMAPLLADASNVNAINSDDGDRMVGRHGTISNRLGFLVDAGLSQGNYRAFARVSSFYDAAIDRRNANAVQATFNALPPANEFSSAVRENVGARTRLLDAYVQGRWQLSEQGTHPLTVKVGRQVLAWGEGLYFMGIGGSMNPQDAYKAQIPGTPVKELFLPTEQVSATLGLGSRLTLMGYGKWAFRESEVMPVGSYFSYTDLVGPGATFMRFTSGAAAPGAWRAPDVGRKSSGQWGAGVKYQLTEATDIGLYHLRYNELLGLPEFEYYGNFWQLGQGPMPMPALANLAPSSFRLRYMENIRLTGASFSTRLGEYNVAGELAYRDGAPVLMSDLHYGLARARVVNAQLSGLRIWGSDFLGGLLRADTAQLTGEVASSAVRSFDSPSYTGAPLLPPALKYDRNSLAYVLGLAVNYLAVMPGWDLAIPIDWQHQLRGNPAWQGWNSGLQGENDRRLSVGMRWSYQQNLELGLRLTHYLGRADLSDRTLRNLVDRDFVALTVSYHF